MKKILLGLVVAVLVFVGTLPDGDKAYAQVADYDVDYTATNFYADTTVIWEMTGLDAGTNYLWSIETVNDSDAVLEVLGSRQFTGGTSYNMTWGAGVSPFGEEWPQDYTGPIRVTDNFGQVVARHYLAPVPVDDWTTTSGNTNEGLKQVAGVPRHESGCRNPVYFDINSDGWHHPVFEPCAVSINQGDYFILHFRLNFADYGDGDFIQFDSMPGGTAEVVFDIDELIDYNYGGYSGGLSQTNTFVIVNTSDELLPFIDYGRSDAAFSVSSGDPHRASVSIGVFDDPGAYSCQRFATGPTWQSDCESVLLISEAISGTPYRVQEWTAVAEIDPIGTLGTQIASRSQTTEAIWDAYSGTWELTDLLEGVQDTTTYSFGDIPDVSYSVGLAEGITSLWWDIVPSGIDTNLMTTDEAHFEIGLSTEFPTGVYTIDATAGTVEKAEGLLEALGFDSPLGNVIALVIIMIIGLVSIAGLTGNTLAQIIVFEAIGGIFIVLGFANTLTTTLFLVGSLLIWVWFFSASRNKTGEF